MSCQPQLARHLQLPTDTDGHHPDVSSRRVLVLPPSPPPQKRLKGKKQVSVVARKVKSEFLGCAEVVVGCSLAGSDRGNTKRFVARCRMQLRRAQAQVEMGEQPKHPEVEPSAEPQPLPPDLESIINGGQLRPVLLLAWGKRRTLSSSRRVPHLQAHIRSSCRSWQSM